MKVQKLSEKNRIKDPKIIKILKKAFNNHQKVFNKAKNGDIEILIRYLYKNYPGDNKQGSAWIYSVLPKEDVESYIKQGVFVISKDKSSIGLGPNGLALISMWNTERLSKVVILLTIATILLSIVSIIVNFI